MDADRLPLPKWDQPALVVPVRIGYPVRGNLWKHPGEIHAHLQTGEHSGKFPADWVKGLTSAEAESLHSDDHENRVKWQYVPPKTKPKSPAFCPPGQP